MIAVTTYSKPKIPVGDWSQILEIHTKGRFPREFAYQKKYFHRNEYVWRVESIIIRCDFNGYKDCYLSVYSFEDFPEDGVMWDRNAVVVDTLYFDFDCKQNPNVAFKEVKKFVAVYLSKGVVPRVYFSGYKGFHVFVDFEPVTFESAEKAKRAVKSLGRLVTEALELKTIDFNVFDVARVSRIPGTVNTKSNLLCVPLPVEKLEKLTFYDVVHYAKQKLYTIPEPTEDYDVPEVLERLAEENPELTPNYCHDYDCDVPTPIDELERLVVNAPYADRVPKWFVPRAILYTREAKKYGYLAKSETVRRIHLKSEWLARHNYNEGALEHIARVHYVCILISLGLTDTQIHAFFRLFHDYDYKKTQYFIEYNRRKLGVFTGR